MFEQMMRPTNLGKNKTLTNEGLIVALTSATEYTFVSDYDLLMIVTQSVSNSYRPTYNGTQYEYNKSTTGAATGAGCLIPNIKSGTKITFEVATNACLFGYRYA